MGCATVVQTDACRTGAREVAGLIPDGSGNICSWRLIMKWSFSPFS